MAHEEFLAMGICQGLRPNLKNVEMPQLLNDLIGRCWDADPLRRPTIKELKSIFGGWWNEILHEKKTEFYQQYKEIEIKEEKKTFHKLLKTHPQAVYTSRSLNFKNLPKPQNSKKINETFHKLTEELEELRVSDQIKFSAELERRFKELENEHFSEDLAFDFGKFNLEKDNKETKEKYQTHQEIPPK